MFGWHSWQLLLAELGTLALVWYIGTRGASSSANLQTVIAGLIVALIVAIWWAGDIKPANIPFPAPGNIELTGLFAALSVMFWCFVGLEAFAHLASEFKNPERDFPRALMIGLLLAGLVYWGQCKSTNRYCRTYRRADCRYLVGGRYQTCEYPLPCARKYRTYRVICCDISDVLVFCRSVGICTSCLVI